MSRHLEALRDLQEQFGRSIPLVDPATPVPWCGAWTVRDLVLHLAEIHQWAAAKAARRPGPLFTPDADLVGTYTACAAELWDVLSSLDPDARADTLLDDGLPAGQRTGTVRFWHRRQALETLVHLWDLRTAAGLPFEPGPHAWADCLDEVVTVMHPRQLRLGRVPAPPARVRLLATDAAAEHVLRGSPAAPEIVVAGPVRSLALLAWGRLAPTDPSLAISGEVAVLDAVLAHGLTP
ncbi:maleylpyruvate isomerase family mycothiol-dependent enzyme [Propionicimonas sp.]|uniref:maleylpyruvate isomerase family mycothiol-dependent enzyme n=1 Tax=Propionicimonas sp. TaxID=1955623 RepID=UPI0039E4A42B